MASMISYDTATAPEADPAIVRAAKRLGLHQVYILCDEPDAAAGVGVWFIVFLHFLPRIGDKIDF